MSRAFAFFALALLLVGGMTAPARAQQYMEPVPPLPAGTRAPAFQTVTTTGKPISLRSLRGKVVLLDYWATWCGPCRGATPMLQRLHQKYQKRGLRVVGLSVDEPATVPQVRPFMRQFGVTYAVATAPDRHVPAARAYNVRGIPSQYLIDKHGIVRWSTPGFGPDEEAELNALIPKLLKEK